MALMMYSTIALVLLASLCLSPLPAADSEIIPYSGHVLYPLRPEFLTIPKLSSSDAPHWSPGHGRSYIDLSRLKFYTTCGGDTGTSGCKNTTIELLMFMEPSDRFWMDYWPDRNFVALKKW